MLALVVPGALLAFSQFAEWPNSSAMIAEIRPAIAARGCPCLIVENNVVDYYLLSQTLDDQFVNLYYFRYAPRPGVVLHGAAAYEQAIRERYFRLVEIDPSESPALYPAVVRALASSGAYRMAAAAPSKRKSEPFEIWVRIGGGR